MGLYSRVEEVVFKKRILRSRNGVVGCKERSETIMVDHTNDDLEERKKGLGYEWIKSEATGNSYLCPVGSIKDKENATDEELKAVCVDESTNPQND
jgi:hypothetical protein